MDWDPEGELLAEVEREVYPSAGEVEYEWHRRPEPPAKVKSVRVRAERTRKPKRPRFLATCPHCGDKGYGAHCGTCGTALYLRAS